MQLTVASMYTATKMEWQSTIRIVYCSLGTWALSSRAPSFGAPLFLFLNRFSLCTRKKKKKRKAQNPQMHTCHVACTVSAVPNARVTQQLRMALQSNQRTLSLHWGVCLPVPARSPGPLAWASSLPALRGVHRARGRPRTVCWVGADPVFIHRHS